MELFRTVKIKHGSNFISHLSFMIKYDSRIQEQRRGLNHPTQFSAVNHGELDVLEYRLRSALQVLNHAVHVFSNRNMH